MRKYYVNHFEVSLQWFKSVELINRNSFVGSGCQYAYLKPTVLPLCKIPLLLGRENDFVLLYVHRERLWNICKAKSQGKTIDQKAQSLYFLSDALLAAFPKIKLPCILFSTRLVLKYLGWFICLFGPMHKTNLASFW